MTISDCLDERGKERRFVMALELVFECPRTLEKLRSGPLSELLDGFCDWLLEHGFARYTVRTHLSNVSHLNEHLGARNGAVWQILSAQAVKEFLKQYPLRARNRGQLDEHVARVRFSVSRFIEYLRFSGLFEPSAKTPIYQPLRDQYLQWLREHQHVSAGTIEIRSHSISQFLHWLGPQATPQGCAELNAETIECFFLPYAQKMGRSARRSMQAALRTFLRFCLSQGYVQRPLQHAVPTWRTYKLATVPRGLTNQQALKVLQSIDRNGSAGRRDYAICQLLYTYGVRGGQVRALRYEDIDWAHNQILFRASKHGKESLLPLTVAVGESLLEYLKNARPSSSDPHVFLTSRAPYHALVRSNALSAIVERHLRKADIQVSSKGAHAFRHCFASRMLQDGHSLKAVADVLGHHHLGTTFIYTKVDFNSLRQVALPWPKEVAS
jgi:integrase/recombinase XerD